MDKNSKQIFTQLFLERSAYDLILKLLNAEEAVKETEVLLKKILLLILF